MSIGQQKNTSTLISKMNTPLSPQIFKRVSDIIKKKASLYGLPQLSNPINYKMKQSILIPRKLINQRSHSSLIKKYETKPKNLSQPQPSLTPIPSPSLFKQSPTHPVRQKQRLFPTLHSFNDLLSEQRQILHVFKDKLQYDLNDIIYYYLRILVLAIEYEDDQFNQQIDLEKSIIINTLQMINESLLELGFMRVAFYLAAIAVDICEFYKEYTKIGRFLLIMAKVLRKLFKYQESILLLKKSLEYIWLERRLCHHHANHHGKIHQQKRVVSNSNKLSDSHISSSYNQSEEQDSRSPSTKNKKYKKPQNSTIPIIMNTSIDKQLQLYNQLSYCLLQLNKKQQSQIFAEKYQIGYIERENSNVINLSKQLINSAQKRIIKWQRVDKNRFYIILGVELDDYLRKNQIQIKNKFNQTKFLKDLKFNFDMFLQNFIQKQMFFYQIPLPLQLRKQISSQYITRSPHKKLPSIITPKFVMKPKLINKQRSTTLKKNKNQNIQENKILIYREIGFCRTKLTNLIKNYINFIKKMLDFNGKQ